MCIVNVYVESLNQRIEQISKKIYKDEHEKYLEVCTNYANIISVLSKIHAQLTLDDLLPITNIFSNYQTNYFGEDE